MAHPPVIDVSGLDRELGERDAGPTVRAIATACADWGFFQVIGHDVPPQRVEHLADAARRFFALPGIAADRSLSRAHLDVADDYRDSLEE